MESEFDELSENIIISEVDHAVFSTHINKYDPVLRLFQQIYLDDTLCGCFINSFLHLFNKINTFHTIILCCLDII